MLYAPVHRCVLTTTVSGPSVQWQSLAQCVCVCRGVTAALRHVRHWVRGVPVPDRRYKSPHHAPTPCNAAPTAFLELQVLGVRTEEGVLQHLLDRSAGNGTNKGERIIYFHSSRSPLFSYSSFLYFLLCNLFFFTIRRLSQFQLCGKHRQHRHYELQPSAAQ
jgi:hypothetical protein